MVDMKSSLTGNRARSNSSGQGKDKVALVTPCLSHLPFHPSCFLGYGASVLAFRYEVDILDLNAQLHFKHKAKLDTVLSVMDKTQTISDTMFLSPFYEELEAQIDRHYAAIPWEEYASVYVTPPSWFPTVPAEAILRLSRAVKRVSPETMVFFFGNSLGSWTNGSELRKNGIQTVHLNDITAINPAHEPVRYDLLPPPIYEDRDAYLFDLLPFVLQHGCSWGRCKFCSFCKGSNAGHLERAPEIAFQELQQVVDRYAPRELVCRDHSFKGGHLVEFCGLLERLHKPWCGQSRADLISKEVEALAKAGCRLIFFGLESGSDRTLSAINKGITSRQMSNFVKCSFANGILPLPSLMVGAPGEEKADFDETVQFLVDHRQYFEIVNVYPFMTTPASHFCSQESVAQTDTPVRLLRFVRRCEDLGLKVCLGEQTIEYSLFKWLDTLPRTDA